MVSRQSVKFLGYPPLWLLGIGSGLTAIHLTLLTRVGQEELFSTSLLYWIAIGNLIWQRRDHLDFKSGVLGTLLGGSLISLLLFRSLSTSGNPDVFLRLLPLLGGIGLGLVASGVRGVRQYWQELTVMSCLIPHPGVLSHLYDLSFITAKFSTAILIYMGVDASQEGSVIALPKGFVGVNPGCSGYGSIMQLFGISMIFLFMFSVPRIQKIIIPLVAVLIAFLLNAVRVAIMAMLAVEADKNGFLYWHDGQGALLFSIIAVSLFGLFCFFLIQQNESADDQELPE